MIDQARICVCNDASEVKGSFVLYWMQQSQRAIFNHALEYAIGEANRLALPIVVGFGLTDAYPEANERHYAFMLEGLAEVAETLAERGIKCVVRRGSPDAVALTLAEEAALVVADRGYLRHQKAWRRRVADAAPCRMVRVEADVVVPVETVSHKHETMARTIRPKLQKLWNDSLQDLAQSKPDKSSLSLDLNGDVDIADPNEVLKTLKLDHSVKAVRNCRGGTSAAQQRLEYFLRNRLQGYEKTRNEPAARHTSRLSPYLHFGQIAPMEVALKVNRAKEGTPEDRAAFLEELIVQRELAANFVHFEPHYDSYQCLPDWAKQTLQAHRDDPREHHYTCAQLEAAETHDPYWNAAMTEMQLTGYMQGYMRMYWGKKILEWSNTPEYAFQTVLSLNNKYFLDGRDVNSFANVAWCFGLHDRPWQERPVFGKVRYMNANGLKRKFDIEAYVKQVAEIAREAFS